MGGQPAKECPKEEVIVAQNGAGNEATTRQDLVTLQMTSAIMVLAAIVFTYVIWKRVHKCLTRKIDRQAAVAAVRSRRVSV